MGATFHRFLTGGFAALAVIAFAMAWMSQTNVHRQQAQLDRQRLVNFAVTSALSEQRKLNAMLSRNLIRLMRQRAGAGRAVPARYLTTR